jgi:hypothetical protein
MATRIQHVRRRSPADGNPNRNVRVWPDTQRLSRLDGSVRNGRRRSATTRRHRPARPAILKCLLQPGTVRPGVGQRAKLRVLEIRPGCARPVCGPATHCQLCRKTACRHPVGLWLTIAVGFCREQDRRRASCSCGGIRRETRCTMAELTVRLIWVLARPVPSTTMQPFVLYPREEAWTVCFICQ